MGSQNFAGRKVLGTNHDKTAGGRAPAERPAEVLRDVPAVREGQPSACHACLQRGPIPAFGEQDNPKKHLNQEAGSWRQEHLP